MNPLKLPPLRLGASYDIPIRVESDNLIYARIAHISNDAPPRITTTDEHGIPDGWRASVVDAKGLTDLNGMAPKRVSVIDDTTIDFPGISTLGYRAHTAGTGAVAFYEPMDLSGYTGARMDIKRSIGGEALLTLSTGDGTLEIDAANSAVWLHIVPETLASLAARDYVFDIELVNGADVLALCSAESVLRVLPEITTSTLL
jgi:hypothetical protein